MIIVLAVAAAGFMVFDGIRALTVGDYLTPSSGEYEGQLGPWSSIVGALGLDPRSSTMKWIFVGYGTTWLVVAAAFAQARAWAWWAMVAMAVGSLWYLILGTLISVLILVLLMLPGVRSGYPG